MYIFRVSLCIALIISGFELSHIMSQIAKFMRPTWGPPGSHVGPINLAIRGMSLHWYLGQPYHSCSTREPCHRSMDKYTTWIHMKSLVMNAYAYSMACIACTFLTNKLKYLSMQTNRRCQPRKILGSLQNRPANNMSFLDDKLSRLCCHCFKPMAGGMLRVWRWLVTRIMRKSVNITFIHTSADVKWQRPLLNVQDWLKGYLDPELILRRRTK